MIFIDMATIPFITHGHNIIQCVLQLKEQDKYSVFTNKHYPNSATYYIQIYRVL
jgi:hypothetical protein